VLVPPVPLLDPKTVPQFVNSLPAALDPSFVYQPDAAGNHYTVAAAPATWDILGNGLTTPVFGYGTPGAPTYPGKTFVVQKNQAAEVTWVNGLPGTHVVNVDPTVLDPDMDYDGAANEIAEGIPIATHLHGGHTDAVYDGTPLQWYTASGEHGADYSDTRQWNPTRPANTFRYANDQDATTLWYHDHAMGVTRLNAYAGMAGFYLIRDGLDTGAGDNPATPNVNEQNPLGLPANTPGVGANGNAITNNYEIPIAIQDKQFLSDGRLWFPAMAQTHNGVPNVASMDPEMFGDVIVANGKAWPKLDVQPKRYRLRLLNGSDSRFYTMGLSSAASGKNPAAARLTLPIWQIGTDSGLLNAPVQLKTLTLAPGERADVIVDFTGLAAGTKFILTNSGKTPAPGGSPVVPGLTDRVMMFNVVASDGTADRSVAPALLNLRPTAAVPAPPAVAPSADKQVALYESLDGLGRVTPLLGDLLTAKPFDVGVDNVNLGTQVWEIYNTTADTHPIHLHQVAFQLLSRQAFKANLVPTTVAADGTQLVGIQPGSITLKGAAAIPTGNEVAYKDTIQIAPGEVVKVRANFDLFGKYVWHCHILSHEEHDMMRFMQVGDNPFPTPRGAVPAAPLLATTTTTTSDPTVTAPLAAATDTFSVARVAVNDVIGATPEDTLAGSAAADVLA
jgi:spore coat protein A